MSLFGRVTKRDEDHISVPDPRDELLHAERANVRLIEAYEVAAIPAPANLWGLAFTPSRVVEAVKLRTVEGEWVAL